MLGERVGKLEGGDENEGATQREEEVAWRVEVCSRGDSKREGEQESPNCEENAAEYAADSRTVAIEDSPDGKSCDVCGDCGNGEHQVQAKFLSVTGQCAIFQFLFRA